MTNPTTIDLFAGAGGITQGFKQAGFECLFANDFNADAMETFKLNQPGTRAVCGPVENLDPKQIREEIGIQKGDLSVLVGGPPCQGFSINAPERFVEDPRNSLFKHFVRFLDEFAPEQFLMENVPGMLSLAGGKVFEQILAEFRQRGYRCTPRILLSAHYGVPQIRWRLIVMGSRLSSCPSYPEPTHYYDARPNFGSGVGLVVRPLPQDQVFLKPAITLRAAISDLPPLNAGDGDEVSTYKGIKATSEYARRMREGTKKLFNHTSNKLAPINFERLKHIPPGGAWVNIPFDLLPAGMKRAKKGDHTKRYGRLEWESLSGTMLTKCDPHWGAVFHPDQDRTFSVREAARIQSFPDSYRFLGARVSQYEQVGNAVPVLMAESIARSFLACRLQNHSEKPSRKEAYGR